jgi:hypothetical protein
VRLCAVLALALLTLETGLLVWVVALLCLALWRPPAGTGGKRVFPWREAAAGLALAGLCVLMAWPGAVLKISLVKIPALYLYRVLSGGAEYAGVQERQSALLTTLLPMLVLAPLAGAWLWRVDRAGLRRWGPFVVMGGVYGLVLARFALVPQYLLPALAPLICVVGSAADRLPSPRAAAAVVAAMGVLLLISWSAWLPPAPDAALRTDLRWLGETLRGREVLADAGHIYQHYLGPSYAIRPLTVPYDGNSLTLREGGKYRALTPADVAGKVVIVQASRREFLGREGERALLGACGQQDRPTVRVYDCPRE